MGATPLAFHITFGTYGTRLHGDDRGTVDRRRNRPGEPVIGRDDDWNRAERALLRFAPVVLALPQRCVIEALAPTICQRGGWALHACAARPDHVHTLLSAPAGVDGEVVRRLLKRWLSEGLSQRWPLPDHAVWWAEAGSVRWVWDRWYFDSVDGYVRRQKTLGGAPAVRAGLSPARSSPPRQARRK